jgi:hypothetical protein
VAALELLMKLYFLKLISHWDKRGEALSCLIFTQIPVDISKRSCCVVNTRAAYSEGPSLNLGLEASSMTVFCTFPQSLQ